MSYLESIEVISHYHLNFSFIGKVESVEFRNGTLFINFEYLRLISYTQDMNWMKKLHSAILQKGRDTWEIQSSARLALFFIPTRDDLIFIIRSEEKTGLINGKEYRWI